MNTSEKLPVVVLDAKPGEKQVVLIDINRISHIILLYDKADILAELGFSPDNLYNTFFSNFACNAELRIALKYSDQKIEPHFIVSNPNKEEIMNKIKQFHNERGISEWHFVIQSTGIAFRTPSGQPSPEFICTLIISLASQPNEPLVVVNMAGPNANKYILRPN